MSGFVIIRHQKLKSVGHVQAAIHHNDRTTKPKNADPSRSHLNVFEGGGMAKLRENLASVTLASTAKDPVLAIEYVVTATPEQINAPGFDREGYFKAARTYLDNLLGADNLIHTGVHYDERTAHGHFIYTPIIELEASTRRRSVVVGKTEDGKQKREVREFATQAGRALNAKKFTGRDASIALQTTFAEQVGAPFGLRRGIAGSKAKHTEVKAFYGQLQQDLAAIEARSRQLEVQGAAQEERGDDLDQRGVDLYAAEKALERDRAECRRRLESMTRYKDEMDARIDVFIKELEGREKELEGREKALQTLRDELVANPPTSALKARSKVFVALVDALPEAYIKELPAELRKAVRLVRDRNNEPGLGG